MCGTKLKNCRALVLCPVVLHDAVSCCVVSHMCELGLTDGDLANSEI